MVRESNKNHRSKFVEAMLKSSQEKKDIKPQTSYGNVNSEQLEKVMANIKKGVFRK